MQPDQDLTLYITAVKQSRQNNRTTHFKKEMNMNTENKSEMNEQETPELNMDELMKISGGRIRNQGQISLTVKKLKLMGYSEKQVVASIRKEAVSEGYLVNPTPNEYEKLATFVADYYNSLSLPGKN